MASKGIVDDFSPINVGDTGNPFSIYVANKNGFQRILGSTVTMTMQNVDIPNVIKTCAGPWTIDSNDNGKAYYQYQASDVDTAGSWYMRVKIVLPNGGIIHPDDGTGSGMPKILVIKSLPIGV